MDSLWTTVKGLEGEEMFTSGRGLPFEIIKVSDTGMKIRTSTGSVYSLGRERIEGACRLRQKGNGVTRGNLLRAGFTEKEAGNLSYTPAIVGAVLGITTEQAMRDAGDVAVHAGGHQPLPNS